MQKDSITGYLDKPSVIYLILQWVTQKRRGLIIATKTWANKNGSGRPNVEFWHSAEAEAFGKKPKHSAEYSAEYFYINKSSFWASDKEFFKA